MDELEDFNILSIDNIEPDTQVLNGNLVSELLDCPLENVVVFENEFAVLEEECDTCDPADYYKREENYFKIINLFSELSNEYERAIARRNLGVADEYTLVWGNIHGNIINQTDLYELISNLEISKFNNLIDELNIRLGNWGYDIRMALDEKANIFSPAFKGIPTVPTPELFDNSSQIANTEWVNIKIDELNAFNLKFFTSDKSYAFIDEIPINITLSWDYDNPVTFQSINNNIIDINERSLTIPNITHSTNFVLKYTIDNKNYTKTLIFNIYYPIYYGVSSNTVSMYKTKDKDFSITAGIDDYIYISLPYNTKNRIAVDNIIGGFLTIGTFLLNSVRYTLYRTKYKGLGQLNITIYDK